ncbi:hypothetical protein C1645_831924 [Glomus cerebriforme]|uniref:Uncharacterized protein n=1 Tax=Glomus cerebriforme TaxID=658196 RepID=A0A397SL09_9GLOM|nr:hypothetical protein C1645_831924 [Glomus cerebriforme]
MCLQEVIRKIVSFISLLSPIEWFTWFSYFLILPMCSLLGWLALPFVVVAFIIANIFGAIQLYSRDELMNDTFGISNDNNIDEMFVSTRKALETIFPQNSEKDIEKYEEQLSKIDNFDPVLIISANQNWINQNTYAAYEQVMDAFATDSHTQNRRRDLNSRCIFHFPNLDELYTVRDNICAIHSNAFYDRNATVPQEPIGTAWILYNVAVRKSDFAQDTRFFTAL